MAQHVIIPTIQGLWQKVPASFVDSLLWVLAITSKESLSGVPKTFRYES